jgi:hypothetical protein
MARKIEAMHQLFGRYKGQEAKQCSQCSNFHRYRYQGVNYKKCEAYGETHSEATDWNVSYEACGLFNQGYQGTPVIDLLKHSSRPKEDTPIDGQITVDEWLGGE